jgi:acetylornithine deacetylase
VGEPTENKLASGSKGSIRFRLSATGTGGHSAYPERGRSAIHTLLDVLSDLRRTTWPADPVFGPTTCNIGVLSGGAGANVIAPDAHADLQLRLATEDAPVRALIEQAVAGRASIEYLSITPRARFATVPGFEESIVGFTTDAPHLGNWGTPVLLGPGSIHDAHMPGERLAKAELVRGIDQYVRLARALLAHPAPVAAAR